MRAAVLLTCLWPGLTRLWLRGNWIGLVWATAFAAVVNVLLVATFVWPQWLAISLLLVGWPVAGCVWTYFAWTAFRDLSESYPLGRSDPQSDAAIDERFAQAQTEYLRGDWYKAETLLVQILRSRPHDVEARLLLVTSFRHTKRVDDARRQLRLLTSHEASEKWKWEIAREQERLAELTCANNNTEGDIGSDAAAENQLRLSDAA